MRDKYGNPTELSIIACIPGSLLGCSRGDSDPYGLSATSFSASRGYRYATTA